MSEENDIRSEIEGKYLTFWIGEQMFAVPIADVMSITQMQQITEIPEFPSYAKGVIDLRGRMVPILDVRLRLGKEEIPYTDHTCIIVAVLGDNLIGLIVDSVDEVTKIEPEAISPRPTLSGDAMNSFLSGIGKRGESLILLLDTRKVACSEVFETMQERV